MKGACTSVNRSNKYHKHGLLLYAFQIQCCVPEIAVTDWMPFRLHRSGRSLSFRLLRTPLFQDTFLFYDTLYENIAVGSSRATRDTVIAAARAAQCHEFIEKLPNGYETRIGDKGVFLSGGEAQRVCVARAILKNAPILVLDEATAFADPENEYKMQQALKSLIKDKTVIIIAHRLSSIVSSDRIIVLKDGRAVQCGRHEELSSQEGVYKKMWNAYTSAFRWQLNVKQEKE